MIRIAALGLFHEANTFAPARVGRDQIADSTVRGRDIEARYGGGMGTMSGYLALPQLLAGVCVVPLVMTDLVPSGVIERGAFEECVQEMVRALERDGPFDGIVLAQHGSMVADGTLDADGYVLKMVRATVGPDVPIGVSLDLHANISSAMVSQVDVLNTYRTNPHVDAKEVAIEVGRLVVSAATSGRRPSIALRQVPAAINILRMATSATPMRELLELREEVASWDGMLSASVAEGYPYADVAEMGMSVVAVAETNDIAQRAADVLADAVWAVRNEFDGTAVSPAVAIQTLAEAVNGGTTLLMDVGDNIGGGAPGSSTAILRTAQALGLESLLTIITNPVAAAACHLAGPGSSITIRLDSEAAVGREEVGTVLALHDGRFESDESLHGGTQLFQAGMSAAIRLESGQTVVVMSKPVMPLTTRQLAVLGLDVRDFRAVVAKGVHSPLAGYRHYVDEVVLVDSPGVTAANLRTLDYQRRRVPMVPFEVVT